MATKLPKTQVKQFNLDLRLVKSNEEQSRGEGALPEVVEQGHSIVGDPLPDHPDKKSLLDLLLSKDGDEIKLGLELVAPALEPIKQKGDTEIESALGKLVRSLTFQGQAQEIGVRPILTEPEDGSSGVETGFFNIVFGMQRCIAKAIISAKSNGTIAPVLRAVIVDWGEKEEDLYLLALAENQVRKGESPLDQAKFFDKLKRQYGMDMSSIAKACGESYQTVRNRLLILKLDPTQQARIHAGTLNWTTAVGAYNKAREEAKKAREAGLPVPAKTEIPDSTGERRRIPTLRQALKLYEAVERPDDCTEVEWELLTEDVRKWIAHYGLPTDQTYKTRAQLLAQREDEERKELEAEKARKAAEAAEKAEKNK